MLGLDQLLRAQRDERLLGALGFEQFDDSHAVGVETLDVGAAKLHILAHVLRFDLVGVVELVVGPHQRTVGGVEPMVDVGQLAVDFEIAVLETLDLPLAPQGVDRLPENDDQQHRERYGREERQQQFAAHRLVERPGNHIQRFGILPHSQSVIADRQVVQRAFDVGVRQPDLSGLVEHLRQPVERHVGARRGRKLVDRSPGRPQHAPPVVAHVGVVACDLVGDVAFLEDVEAVDVVPDQPFELFQRLAVASFETQQFGFEILFLIGDARSRSAVEIGPKVVFERIVVAALHLGKDAEAFRFAEHRGPRAVVERQVDLSAVRRIDAPQNAVGLREFDIADQHDGRADLGIVNQPFVAQLFGQRTGHPAIIGRRVELEMAVMPRQRGIGPGPGPFAAGGVRNVPVFADDAVTAFHIDRFVADDIVQFVDRPVEFVIEFVPAARREEYGGKQQTAEASVHGKMRVSVRQDTKIRNQNHLPGRFSGVTMPLRSLIKQARFINNKLLFSKLHFHGV